MLEFPPQVTLSVIGASGGIGRFVVKHALKKGYKVRALVRSQEKFQTTMQTLQLSELQVNSVDLVIGSATDKHTLDEAIHGSDHVISCLGNVRKAKEMIVETGTRNIMESMESSGVKKLQIVSSIGIGDSWEQVKKLSFVFSRIIMPYVIAPTVKDLNAAEAFLLSEGSDGHVQCVIVRPPGLSFEPGTGEYDPKFSTDEIGKYKGSGKYGLGGPMLPRCDIALAMVDMVENEDQFNRHVGKPVSLLPMSIE